VLPLYVIPQGWMVISRAGPARRWPVAVPAAWGASPAYAWASTAIVCEHFGAVDRVNDGSHFRIGDTSPRVVDVYRAGWPFRMLQSVFVTQPARDGVVPDSGTIPVPARLLPGTPRWVTWVPTMPLWAGIAGNALVHGALLMGLVRGLWFVRRRLRIRRGQCAWCAYSLAGAVVGRGECPECGNKVAGRATHNDR
jgi:hypothetical protein